MRIHLGSPLFVLFFFAHASLAAIYTNPLNVTGNFYDFIVVGGQSQILNPRQEQQLIFVSMTSQLGP